MEYAPELRPLRRQNAPRLHHRRRFVKAWHVQRLHPTAKSQGHAKSRTDSAPPRRMRLMGRDAMTVMRVRTVTSARQACAPELRRHRKPRFVKA